MIPITNVINLLQKKSPVRALSFIFSVRSLPKEVLYSYRKNSRKGFFEKPF